MTILATDTATQPIKRLNDLEREGNESSTAQQIFNRVMTVSNLEDALSDLVYGETVNLNEIKRLLPKINNPDLLIKIFNDLRSDHCEHSSKDRAQLLMILCDYVPEETKKTIFEHYILLVDLDEEFLLNLADSMKTPVDSKFLTLRIKNQVDRYVRYCCKNELWKEISFLLHSNRDKTEETLKEVISKDPSLAFNLIDSLSLEMFQWLFTTISNGEYSDKLKMDFFSADRCILYLIGDEATLEHRTLGFHFYWNVEENTDQTSISFITALSNKLYLQNQDILNEFALNQINENAHEFIGQRPVCAITPCLDIDILEKLDEKIEELGDNQLIADYIENNGRYCFHAFKYDFPQSMREFTMVSKGSQIAKDGDVDESVSDLITKLNQNTATAGIPVYFNANHVVDHLTGGTCSAMTLHFLKRYKEARLSTEDARTAIQMIGDKFRHSTKEFRTIQAAYNTIEKLSLSPDFKKAKIAALLKLENPELSIVEKSDEIILNEDPFWLSKIESIFDKRETANYVVRCLCPLKTGDEMIREFTIKEERYGHSTLLIKEEGKAYYYDPAIGTIELESGTQLAMILAWQNDKHEIPLARFYKVN